MTGDESGAGTIQEQLQRAARDLWTYVVESGETHVIFTDRRREHTKIEQQPNGRFSVSWARDDGTWEVHGQTFDNLREAALHGYQGPH